MSDADNESDDLALGDMLHVAETTTVQTSTFNPVATSVAKKLHELLAALAALIDQRSQGKDLIEWWATGGTALGAIRHGGRIPWDDDLDIGMKLRDAQSLFGANSAAQEDLRKLRLCAVPATRVGFRVAFADDFSPDGDAKLDTKESSRRPYPFCDVFCVVPLSSLSKIEQEEWYQGWVMKANKGKHRRKSEARRKATLKLSRELEAAQKHCNPLKRDMWVLADDEGRRLWPHEAFDSSQIAPPLPRVLFNNMLGVDMHRVSKGQESTKEGHFQNVSVPVVRGVEKYLDVMYGDDWQTTARSHDWDHHSGCMQFTISAPLESALDAQRGASF